MNIADMNWMHVQGYLRHDDRAVVPVGSTEQHAYLSLATDAILAERVATEAAEPVGVPVFPALAYGVAPAFLAYPGTVSLRLETYQRIVVDILDSLAAAGFRRVLFVNGHGGNVPGAAVSQEWMNHNPEVRVRWHHWWNAPRTQAVVRATDPTASHASWMENFPWTRLRDVALPEEAKSMVDLARLRLMDAASARAYLGDGNFGGAYGKPDERMMEVWDAGVEETRDALGGPWD
ncbi:MAG TPA: creatininase family protein [Trueperaceae bacterium]|nr:creatininase family protein [Trueperaceae bacterium]